MQKLTLSLFTAVAVVAGASAGTAQAAPAAAAPISDAASILGLTVDAQYMWGGRRYCWYDNGWNGPGWYYCGNPWRQGWGWGGGYGWRGWGRGGRGWGGRGWGGRGGHGGGRGGGHGGGHGGHGRH